MTGSIGFTNGTLVAKNITFDYFNAYANTTPQGPGLITADGQLLIGTIGTFPNIAMKAGFLTPGTGISIVNGPGSITIGLSGGTPVSSITAGANINLTGTATNPIINLNTQILEPNGTAAAPSYSFTNAASWGMLWDGSRLGFSSGNNESISFDSTNLQINQNNATFSGGINIQSYLCPNYTNPGSYPYTVLFSDYYISVDTSGGAHSINFPNSPRTNIEFVVFDRTGNATANNITLTTPGATVLFNGSTTYVMNNNYQNVTLRWNGTGYEVYPKGFVAGTGISLTSGSQGLTITNTSPGTFAPNSSVQLVEDFIGSGNANVGFGSWALSWTTGTATGTFPSSFETAHPGVIANNSIGAGLVFGAFLQNSTNTGFLLGGGSVVVNWVFKIITLSNSTNRYLYTVGLSNAINGYNAGCYFTYQDNINSGNWVITNNNAGTLTATNSSTAVTTGWHNAQITINAAGTSAIFVMDGVTLGTVSTNAPTGTIAPVSSTAQVAGTIGANSIWQDLMYMTINLTTPR